jgi:hypothetical protein
MRAGHVAYLTSPRRIVKLKIATMGRHFFEAVEQPKMATQRFLPWWFQFRTWRHFGLVNVLRLERGSKQYWRYTQHYLQARLVLL